MNKQTDKQAKADTPPPDPVDVVDGIPDRSPNPAVWKYVTLAVIFAVWVAFLIYCLFAGNVAQ